MIIGNGLVAKEFYDYKDKDDFLIFASGVSNSLEEDEDEYNREKILLLNSLGAHEHRRFVYFSTCSIYEPVVSHRRYTSHKVEMESLVCEYANNYVIFRLPQVVGAGGNKHTLLNYLTTSIEENRYFEIWRNASRNFIDVDDLALIVKVILTKIHERNENKVINIASPFSYKLPEIVKAIESEVGKKADCTLVDKGFHYDIPLQEMINYFGDINKIFGDRYLQKLLQKYHCHG